MGWISSLINQSSLRKQMIVTSLLCLVIPVGAIMLISSNFTINLIQERAVHSATESLQVAGAYVTNTMNTLVAITNKIQFDGEITAVLKNPSQGGAGVLEQMAIEKKLEQITSDRQGLYITILQSDGGHYSNYSYYDFDPDRFRKEAWYPELERLGAFDTDWIGVQPTYLQSVRDKQPYVITIARTLRDASNAPYAYVIVSIGESQVRSIFEEYRNSQNMMLLTADGVILSGLDSIGRVHPHFEEFAGSESPSVRSIGGQEQIIVKKELPFNRWILMSLTPYQQATATVYGNLRTNLMLEAGFFVLFLFILVYLLNRFTRPIIRLVQVAAHIEAGNLSIRSKINGSFEFVKLGRSFDNMLDSIEAMVGQITYEQELKRKAELGMLQAQINPHFLFNILNAIRMRIMLQGDRENAQVISSLSQLLRMTIKNHDEFIAMQEEVHIVKEYMNLMNATSKADLHCEIEMEPEVLHEGIPRFILQPLIENAIIHGLRQSDGTIRIHARKEQESLMISVGDDGAGMTEERLGEVRERLYQERPMSPPERSAGGMSGIGLSNVYERLKMIYGDGFAMRIDSREGSGTTISLMIPEREGARHVESGNRG